MREKIKRAGRTFQKERDAARRKRTKARMRVAGLAQAKAFAAHGVDADGIPPITRALRRLRAEADARREIEAHERFVEDAVAATKAAFPEWGKGWGFKPSADLVAAEAAWTEYLMATYVRKGEAVPLRECVGSPAHPLRTAYDRLLMEEELDHANRNQKHRQGQLFTTSELDAHGIPPKLRKVPPKLDS